MRYIHHCCCIRSKMTGHKPYSILNFVTIFCFLGSFICSVLNMIFFLFLKLKLTETQSCKVTAAAIHRSHVTNSEHSEDGQKSQVTCSTHCMADFLKINMSSEYSPLIFKNISVTRNTQAESQQFKAKGKGVASNYKRERQCTYNHNTEPPSLYHFCREKRSIIYSGCVSVVLVKPACNAHAPYYTVNCGLSGYTIFSTLSNTRHDFRRK